jgi:hypothetical protein
MLGNPGGVAKQFSSWREAAIDAGIGSQIPVLVEPELLCYEKTRYTAHGMRLNYSTSVHPEIFPNFTYR